jgi:hypothetical protein
MSWATVVRWNQSLLMTTSVSALNYSFCKLPFPCLLSLSLYFIVISFIMSLYSYKTCWSYRSYITLAYRFWVQCCSIERTISLICTRNSVFTLECLTWVHITWASGMRSKWQEWHERGFPHLSWDKGVWKTGGKFR